MNCNQVGILLCKCIWQANFTSTSHQSHLDGKVYCLKFFVVCVCVCVCVCVYMCELSMEGKPLYRNQMLSEAKKWHEGMDV